jgi:phage protein D
MTTVAPPAVGIPRFTLSIAKVAVSPALKADIGTIELSDDLDMPAMLSFTVNLWDGMRMRLKEDYFEQFALGTSLELSLGLNRETAVFSGEVTALEPEFGGPDGADQLRVRALNRMHRLLFGDRQRTFQNKSSSSIAAEIANEIGLATSVESTGDMHPHLTQQNETDLALLLRLARPLDYEVLVEDKTLFFRRPRLQDDAVATLTYRRDLTEFTPRQRVIPGGASVEVRGWDVKTKQPLLGRAGAGDEAARLGGTRTGAELSAAAFTAATRTLPVCVLADADEATRMAQAAYTRQQSDFIEAQGECAGSPLVRAGRTIDIAGVGKVFGGPYYVVSARHTLGPAGYRTRFEAQRNSA